MINPQITLKFSQRLPNIIRFWFYVDNISSACWIWKGGKGAGGYGMFRVKNKKVMAHRFSYELILGKPINKGLTLDHLCKNRLCVNPTHLEQVTLKDNILRGNSPQAINARKNHCIRGHPLYGNNLYLTKSGGRCCKQCSNISKKIRRFKNKEGLT